MDLNDSQARSAITALVSKYLAPYLSIFPQVTPADYQHFEMGVYDTLTEGIPERPEIYRLSNLYAFKSVARSILTAGHNNKIALETNNPNYDPGVYGEKYIAKYLSATTAVEWLLSSLDPPEQSKVIAKYTSGELDPIPLIAAIGLTLANGGYRLYKAAFDRVPDKKGLGFWISALDKGATIESVALGFIASGEFKAVNGESPTKSRVRF